MSKPVAKIYFVRGHEAVVHDLAARIRNEGNLCHLIYAGLFSGRDDVEDTASAIAIQASSPKAHFITQCYRGTRPEVEIHYFDDEGEFCDAPADPEPPKADPFAKVRPKPVPAPEPKAEDNSEPELDDSADEASPDPA